MRLLGSSNKGSFCGTQPCSHDRLPWRELYQDRGVGCSIHCPMFGADSKRDTSLVQCSGLTYLHMIFGQRRELGILDNQATSNFVAYELACSLGLEVVGESRMITLGDGRNINTRGTVKVQCIVMLPERKRVTCECEVLERTLHRIVLGKPFIRMMRHFQVHDEVTPRPKHSDIRDCFSPVGNIWTTGLYDVRLRTQIQTEAGSKEVFTTLDQGSNAHFVSLNIVKELKMRIVDRWAHVSVTTGDGVQTTIPGSCRFAINLNLRTGGVRKLRIVAYVLKCLPFDLLLGKPIHHVLRQWDMSRALEWHSIPETRLLLCACRVSDQLDPHSEDPTVLGRNLKNHEDARDDSAYLLRLEEEEKKKLKQQRLEDNQKELDRNLDRYHRLVNQGETEMAEKVRKEIERIQNSMAPSPLPPVVAATVRKRHFSKLRSKFH